MVEKLIDEFERAAKEVDNNCNLYDSFKQWLDESESEWEEFTSQEREAFRRTFQKFQRYTKDTIPPGELDEVHEGLESAFRQPLQRAIRDLVTDIDSVLDLHLGESEIDALLSSFENADRETLIERREAYDELEDKLRKAPKPVREYLRNHVKADKSRILSPSDELAPELEQALENHGELKKISDQIRETPWGPELTENDIGVFPIDWLEQAAIQDGIVQESITRIEEVRTNLQEVDVELTPAIREDVSAILNNTSDPLSDQFESVASEIENVSNIREFIKRVRDAQSAIENKESQAISSNSVDVLIENITGSYDDYDKLIQEKESAESEFEDWIHSTSKLWRQSMAIVDVFRESLEFEEPDLEISEDEFNDILISNPSKAISNLIDLQDYIQSKEDELIEEMDDDAVNLLYTIISEDHAPISEFSIDAVEKLHDNIPLEVGFE